MGKPVASAFAVLSLTWSGCAHTQSTIVVPAQGAASATTMPYPPRPLEVRYGTHARPERLTPEQLDEIALIAQAERPARRDIWFILVRANYVYEGKRTYGATVYYAPDTFSARLRTGRFFHIESSRYLTPAKRRELRQRLGAPDDDDLPQYVQISLASRPFEKNLGIPDGPLSPFAAPEDIPQADLIQIVDAARNVHDDVAWAGKQEPLYKVARDGTEFQVMFGEVAGPLSGGGTFVIVRKTPDGYRADNRLGVWRS